MGAKAHDVDLSDSGRKIARKIAKSKGVPAEKDYGPCASCQEPIVLERDIGRKENSVQSWQRNLVFFHHLIT
jgi:hypothetical protein